MGDTKIRVKGWQAVIPWMTDKVRQARSALRRLYHDRDLAYSDGLFVEPHVFSARPVEGTVVLRLTGSADPVNSPGNARNIRQLTAVIDPDLRLDVGFQLGHHGLDDVSVFCRIRGEVDHLARVPIQVKQLDVVRLIKLVDRSWTIVIERREIAGELVAAIEHGAQVSSLLQIGDVALLNDRHQGALPGRLCIRGNPPNPTVNGHQPAIGKEDGVPRGMY